MHRIGKMTRELHPYLAGAIQHLTNRAPTDTVKKWE